MLKIFILSSSPTSFGSDLGSTSSHEFNVAHLEDSRQQFENVSYLFFSELHHLQGFLQQHHRKKVRLLCLRELVNSEDTDSGNKGWFKMQQWLYWISFFLGALKTTHESQEGTIKAVAKNQKDMQSNKNIFPPDSCFLKLLSDGMVLHCSIVLQHPLGVK